MNRQLSSSFLVLNTQPNSSWKKSDIFEWLMQEGKNPFPEMLNLELLTVNKSIKKPRISAVDEMFRKHGLEDLRLPPYHCQFNEIELI